MLSERFGFGLKVVLGILPILYGGVMIAALPNAEVHAYDDAGHYVLEDKAAELVPAIRAFLDRNPL